MTKAAAPMIGGAICPPVEATASTAAAKGRGYPRRIIIGMVKLPVVATFATAEPEIMPKRPLAIVAILAAPPGWRPPSAHGEIHERLTAAGVQQERAEENEGGDDGCGDAGQHAPDAEIAEEDGLGHESGVEAAVTESPGQLVAEERIVRHRAGRARER